MLDAETLKACCAEFLDWHDTGILADGKIRERVNSEELKGRYPYLNHAQRLHAFENEVKVQCFFYMAGRVE